METLAWGRTEGGNCPRVREKLKPLIQQPEKNRILPTAIGVSLAMTADPTDSLIVTF